MKTLLVFLILALSSVVKHPVNSVPVSHSVAVITRGDSIAPTYRKERRYSPPIDEVSILSGVAGAGAVASVLAKAFGPYAFIALFAGLVGLMSLARIRKSRGELGGRLLAWLGVAAGISVVLLLARLLLYFMG